MYVCMHACMHVCIYHMQSRGSANVHIHICTYLHTYAYTQYPCVSWNILFSRTTFEFKAASSLNTRVRIHDTYAR